MKRRLAWLFFRKLRGFSTLFTIIVIANLIFSIYYIQDDRQDAILADREVTLEQIGTSLAMLQQEPQKNYDAIAKITATEQLKVQITKQPLYQNHFHQDFLIHTTKLLQSNKTDFSFSVKINDYYWANYHYEERNYQALVQLGLLGIETFMAVIFLVTLWFIERFRKPLKEFKRIAEQLGVKDNVETKHLNYAPAIIRQTKDAMDKMQQRIIKLLSDRTRLLTSISHDLRTPITRMKMRTQLYTDTHTLDNLRDLEEMSSMIDKILIFSKECSPVEKKVTFDLSSLLLTLCDEAVEIGQKISINIPHHAVGIKGEVLSIKRAISNLLQNALKYADHVYVKLTLIKQHALISIEDDGPGIPDEELSQVFTPFYRTQHSLENDIRGCGLGLAIVHDVLLAHHASIHLENRLEGGLRVLIEFPLEFNEKLATEA